MTMARIAVLCGGYSLEREVSLRSGERVFGALRDLGHESEKFDLDPELVSRLRDYAPHLCYIALHGKSGEDGVIQEMLELMDIPYTGPGVTACRLTFDKALAKEIMKAQGFETPPFVTLDAACFKELGAAELISTIVEKLGLPLIVKPSGQGSSLGIKVVREEEELAKAVIGALCYDNRVVIERFISGTELTVAVLNGDALPIIEIVPPREIFDFNAMYTAGETEYYVPARLDSDMEARVREVALGVCRLFGTEQFSRVDMIVENGTPLVLEINTSPGMTETSLFPMAAEAAGMAFAELVGSIVSPYVE
jgi:D-alanine-D-alanine ligase